MYSNDEVDEWLLNRIWDSEQNWYKTKEVIKREKEAKKWTVQIQEKDQKLTSLQLNESSLKYTVEKLNKREIIKSLNNNLSRDVVILELEESQKLLEIQKTVNSQELEGSKKLVSKSGINVVLILLSYLFQETLEKTIFEKESELIKLSVEMRKMSDEITHLKTREVSLIDKSDALDKGQIIYYM